MLCFLRMLVPIVALASGEVVVRVNTITGVVFVYGSIDISSVPRMLYAV